MLIGAICIGFALGLVAGGRLANLTRVQLRWLPLLFLAVALRYLTEIAIHSGVEFAAAARLPLYVLAFGLLATWLLLNRSRPGLLVAAAGVAANGMAIVLGGGWMPVWQPALEASGLTPADLVTSFHRLLPATFGMDFLLRGGPLADLIPIPVPVITNVASIGDVFMAAGLAWFVFASMVRPRHAERPLLDGVATRTSARVGGGVAAPDHGTGIPAIPIVAASVSPASPRVQAFGPAIGAGPLIRPMTGFGSGIPRLEPLPVVVSGTASGTAAAGAVALPRVALRARVANHPYVRLALDARFSALWLGQTISLFGDRLNQVALGVLVFGLTGSALDVGLVFVAATLPNLVVGPIAGTFVDRWDQKKVLVISDLLRAGLVLVVPVAAGRNIALVYPIVFGVTVVSVFFRPARAAVLPRIVDTNDLTAANGATWTSETLADIVGYPLAGMFVAFLSGSLTVAFWLDAGSYLVSALLVLTIAIPPVVRAVESAAGSAVGAFAHDLLDGWRFLRGESALFANTLISAVAQLSVGATLALAVVYASEVLDGRFIPYPQSYAAIETAIGVGSLLGGFVVGAVGARWRKGPLVIGGYVVMGLATIVMGGTGNVLVALACATVMGISNMAFLIPTQTLFQERTPAELMGRVIGIRFSIVFGSLTGAMAVSSIVADAAGAGAVFVGFGALTAVAGAAGLLIPAVRNA